MKLATRVAVCIATLGLSASVVMAQSAPRTQSPVNPSDGRTGGAGPLGDNPSTGTDKRLGTDRKGMPPDAKGNRMESKGANSTDGRAGGAGPTGNNPSTGTGTRAGRDPQATAPAAKGNRSESKGYNSTDGRTGGAGPMGDNPSTGTDGTPGTRK